MSLIVGLNCETARTGRVRFQSFSTSLDVEVGTPLNVAQAPFSGRTHLRRAAHLLMSKVLRKVGMRRSWSLMSAPSRMVSTN